MQATRWAGVLGLLLVVAAVSCRRQADERALGASGAGSGAVRTFAVTGTVHEVRQADRCAVIAHQAIPGYMMAMTMPFDVKDVKELNGLEAGDIVTFRLLVSETEGWMDTVRKVGHDPSVAPELRKGPRQVPLVDPLEVGDFVPDYTFTNQLGQPLQLSQLRGRVVGLTFFFTRCPYPTFCPRTSGNFAAAARELAAPDSGVTNWHLLQISFDPDYDTPQALRTYAESYGADPGTWTLATGDMMQIDGITEQFGCQFGRDGEFYSHNVRTAVIDPAGKVSLILTGNTWKVETLVEAMKAAAVGGGQ